LIHSPFVHQKIWIVVEARRQIGAYHLKFTVFLLIL